MQAASHSLVTRGLLIDPVVSCCLGRGSEACPLLGCKSDPLESRGLLIDPIVSCRLGGQSKACLPLCCMNDSKIFLGLFIDLVLSRAEAVRPAHPVATPASPKLLTLCFSPLCFPR